MALAVLVGPVASERIGRERARACLARFEQPRSAELPECGSAERWFALPALVPWTKRDAARRIEELRARVAVARYLDAAVGSPNPEHLRQRFDELRRAEQAVASGSGRLRLGDLGPAMPAPDAGALAASSGDRASLLAHGKDWTHWSTASGAIDAALLAADRDAAVRLARRYAGRPDPDLRLWVGALLCLDGQAARGIEEIQTVEQDRAGERHANFARDFGSARVLLEACAATTELSAPPVPGWGHAGELDQAERLAVLRLQEAERRAGCDRADERQSCLAAEPVAEAVRAILDRLGSGVRLAFRLELAAAVAPYFVNAELAAHFATPLPGEPALGSRLLLTVDQWLDHGGGDAPFLSADGWARAGAALAALAADSVALQSTAGACHLRAAAALAARGEPERAARHADRAASLALSDPVEAALVRASVAHLAGGADAALDRLGSALEQGSPHALAELARAEMLAARGRSAEARTLAKEARRAAERSGLSSLAERAAWVELALEALGGTGSAAESPDATTPPLRLPVLGPARPWVQPAARKRTLDQLLGCWRAWLSAPSELRRSYRYRAFQGRGDAPRARVAHLVLAGLLVDDPAEVEPWLDAYYAVDAARMSKRAYTWARAQAARWRGDRPAHHRWLERYRWLERQAAEPVTAVLWEELGL